MGLIVGLPFVALTLALLAIFRRERIHPSDVGTSRSWSIFARVVAVVLVAFVAFMVVELVFKIPLAPPAPGT